MGLALLMGSLGKVGPALPPDPDIPPPTALPQWVMQKEVGVAGSYQQKYNNHGGNFYLPDSGLIIAPGGQHLDTNPFYTSNIYAYDTVTKTWSYKRNLSTTRGFIGATRIVIDGNDGLFMVGGYNASLSRVTDVYTPHDNGLTAYALYPSYSNGTAGCYGSYGVICWDGADKVYFGSEYSSNQNNGFGATYKFYWSRFNIAGNTWTQLANMTYSHTFGAAVADSNQVLLIGGRDQSRAAKVQVGVDNRNARNIDRYDVAGNTWSVARVLDTTLADRLFIGNGAYDVISKRIYLQCTRDGTTAGGDYVSHGVQYDVATDTLRVDLNVDANSGQIAHHLGHGGFDPVAKRYWAVNGYGPTAYAQAADVAYADLEPS